MCVIFSKLWDPDWIIIWPVKFTVSIINIKILSKNVSHERRGV